MTETINKKTDSKSSIDDKVEYVILTMETTEYRKITSLDKNIIKTQGNENLLTESCVNCSSSNLEYYKMMYQVTNMQNYEKKNVDISKRYKEYYYLYGECQNCNTKQRIGNQIFPEILQQKIIKHKNLLERMYSWITNYL